MHRLTPRRRRDLFTTVPMAVTGAIAVSLSAPAAAGAVEVEAQRADNRADGNLALAPTPVAKTSTRLAAATATAYTVQSGDTITGIAIRHGLRTVDVLTWNGLSWSSRIYPGDVLALSASGSASAEKPAAAPLQAEGRVEGTATTKTHTVRSGETVWSISQAYGTSVDRVLSLNDLSADDYIFVGQKLVVASSAASPQQAAPPQEQQAPQTEQTPAPEASPGDETYIVQAGDTLWGIAQAHGVSISELLAANGLSGSSIIYPGQKIVIPAAGSQTPAPQESPQSSTPPSIYDQEQEQLSASLNAPQSENATMIVQIGRELGVSDKGIAIALATSMVEAGLRNLDWGDRDSLGLFQQRPSTGWGSPEQILDRGYAIRAFFGGPNGPTGNATRGLLDIPGWESMDFGTAAQTVQISAFPDRYGRWEQAAYGWLAQLG